MRLDLRVRDDERRSLLELAAALRGEVEARIEGEPNRLLEIAQIVIDTLVVIATPAARPPAPGPRGR